MDFVVDVCLSPEWVRHLTAADFEAIHWSAVGDIAETDRRILEWARSHDRIVFTHDLDFGTILAATGAESPSVVQLREQNTDPMAIGEAVVGALRQFEPELLVGSLLTIDLSRAKARLLPIRSIPI